MSFKTKVKSPQNIKQEYDKERDYDSVQRETEDAKLKYKTQ